MPEISSPDKVPTVSTKQGINWLRVLIGVIIGLVLMGGGYWLNIAIQATQTTTPTTSTTASPSTQKDETAGWKTYNGESMGVKFSFKYPNEFQSGKTPVGEIALHFVGTTTPTVAKLKDKDVLVVVTVATDVELKDAEYQETAFAGLKAKKAIAQEEGMGIVAYYVTNQPPVSAQQHFTVDCRFYPSTETSLKQICEKIASTFKFLD